MTKKRSNTPRVPYGPDYGFGAYIHWPYCSRICPYCDFNVYVAKQRDNSPLLDAIVEDIARHRARMPDHPALSSIYLGGGTPSLLSGKEVERLIAACDASFGLKASAEITLEANPHMVTKQRAVEWRSAGVNRVSLGVQSLADSALNFLGRDHSAQQAREASAIILDSFPSVSLDLIYARPDQKTSDWIEELEAALALGAHHISLYELTIEQGTAFGKAFERGALNPMPDDAQADLFELTHAIMAEAGYPAYEISNFAIATEHQSIHNLTYWRSGDWLGVGPGAHGRLTLDGVRHATVAEKKPGHYVDSVGRHGVGTNSMEHLRSDAAAEEMLAMGLRSIEGIATDRLQIAHAGLVDPYRLEELQSDGWLTSDRERIVLDPTGRLLADRIVSELIT
ncbi:MAG: radical SAM family heme chaperone HemW [Pseudomonadota bacterium]